MIIQLEIIGLLLIALSLVHIGFPKYFKWKDELVNLSLINRQMMQVHTFFIAMVVFLIGCLCFFSAQEIIDTNLGKKIALGLGVFWGLRLFFQLFIYSNKLWKGKVFETSMHIIFTLFWIYMTIIFVSIYLN